MTTTKNLYLLILLLSSILLMLTCKTDQNDSYQKIIYQGESSIIINTVLPNPTEDYRTSSLNDNLKLKQFNFNFKEVIGNNISLFALIKFNEIDKTIENDKITNNWINHNSNVLISELNQYKRSGIKCLAKTDLIMFPQVFYDKHKKELEIDNKINLGSKFTRTAIIIGINEIFDKFTDLDGIIIRTGELYLHHTPYHVGNNIILNGNEEYSNLINLLREEICVKRNKLLIFRTWGYDGFHTDPKYYLNVTNRVAPHKNLIFSIKHTSGDFFRLLPQNATLGIGNHQQIFEFQSQREYEGKGAHPNYLAKNILEGYNESYIGIINLIKHKTLQGVYLWSSGGGWEGPYITNELWNNLNTFVISNTVHNPNFPEEYYFNEFCNQNSINSDQSKKYFRRICLLSQEGILKGQYSKFIDFKDPWWVRDHFLGGRDQLKSTFNEVINKELIEESIKEKEEAVAIWDSIVYYSQNLDVNDKSLESFISTSSLYGFYKYSIINEAWKILILGYHGDLTNYYQKERIKDSILKYDDLWTEWQMLKDNYKDCPSLYLPYSFTNDPANHFISIVGMKTYIDSYRNKF